MRTFRPVAAAVGGPVDVLQLEVVAQGRSPHAPLEEEPEFVPARIGRRASVARDGERTAGIGVLERGRPVLAAEPALQQAGHEAVAGPQHVEHLDGEAGPGDAIVGAVGNRSFERHGTHGTALADEHRIRHRPHAPQRLDDVGRPARDVELLLGADDEVESMQVGLEPRGHTGALHVAALALAVARHSPEVRAVVDVERGPGAVFPCEPERLQHRRLGSGMAEMRARRDDAPRLGNEVRVDVVLRERHVGAVFPVEDERELPVVADAENGQGGETPGVRLHAPHVHALAYELLADEPAHVLVADSGDHRGAHPEPRHPRGHVGGRPADVLPERCHVLQPPAHLGAVEIDGASTDGDGVERLAHGTSSS